MTLGIEPKGVDLVVEPTKRSKEDLELVSRAIAHYKATGEKLSVPNPNLLNRCCSAANSPHQVW